MSKDKEQGEEERKRKRRKEVRKDERAWSRLCLLMLRCWRKGRQ